MRDQSHFIQNHSVRERCCITHATPIKSQQQGRGLLSIVKDAIREPNDESYPGEKHVFLKMPSGKLKRANYMGPGTELIKRLQTGSRPLTAADKVSQRHDIDYSLAKDAKDMRAADNRMIRKLKAINNRGGDSRLNIQLGMKGIQAKTILEDMRVVGPTAFTSIGGDYSQDETALMQAKKAELEQQGYGKIEELRKVAMKMVRQNQKKRKKPAQAVSGRDLKLQKVMQRLDGMSGEGKKKFLKSFAKGFKKGFTGTMKAAQPLLPLLPLLL